MCHAPNGGLLVVYGKTYALQAVARAQSKVQPHPFLVINMGASGTCLSLYDTIEERVLGNDQDLSITTTELAEVIKYGLRGPVQKNRCP